MLFRFSLIALAAFLMLDAPAVQAQERSTTVEVVNTGRNAVRNCNRLIRQLDRIDDNSAERRYLFIIDPGVLDCGDSQVVMKDFVDIEGSGRGVTQLLGSAVIDSFILAADNSELRGLSVKAIASGDGVTGIFIDGTLGPNNARITDVAVEASGGNFTFAVRTAGPGAAPTLTNVKAITTDSSASGEFGSAAALAVNDEAELVMINSQAIGDPFAENSFGLNLFGGPGGSTVTARNSVLSGELADVVVDPPDTLNVISTQLTGAEQGPGDGGGTLNCVGAYDGNFQPLDETCVEIPGTALEKIVFLTSQTFNGDLGGIEGADALCNAAADAAGLPGSYMAWLADSTPNSAPLDRFTQSTVPYVLPPGPSPDAGQQIADDWDDLTSCTPGIGTCLDHPISVNEFGESDLLEVWSNVTPSGTALRLEADHHCSNWTTSSGSVAGNTATPDQTDGAWTSRFISVVTCRANLKFYCFEQ